MDKNTVRECYLAYKDTNLQSEVLNSPEKVSSFLRKLITETHKEHFIVLYLNTNHEVLGYTVVSKGTLNQCPVHPRDVFGPALLQSAYSVLIAHNHPSGHTAPSKEDNNVTSQLKQAAQLLGIKLLDHVIFSTSQNNTNGQSFYSYSEVNAL